MWFIRAHESCLATRIAVVVLDQKLYTIITMAKYRIPIPTSTTDTDTPLILHQNLKRIIFIWSTVRVRPVHPVLEHADGGGSNHFLWQPVLFQDQEELTTHSLKNGEVTVRFLFGGPCSIVWFSSHSKLHHKPHSFCWGLRWAVPSPSEWVTVVFTVAHKIAPILLTYRY